jgi:hypothetical protein
MSGVQPRTVQEREVESSSKDGDKGMSTKAHDVGTPKVCSGRIP